MSQTFNPIQPVQKLTDPLPLRSVNSPGAFNDSVERTLQEVQAALVQINDDFTPKVNAVAVQVNEILPVLPAVATVGQQAASIATVANHIASVDSVAVNIADVDTVAGAVPQVKTTAQNIAAINTAATNISAINASPAAATAAAGSASAAAVSATAAATSASQAAESKSAVADNAINAAASATAAAGSATAALGYQQNCATIEQHVEDMYGGLTTGATPEPTPLTPMARDKDGRSRVEAPASDKDVANKKYVDNALQAEADARQATDAALAGTMQSIQSVSTQFAAQHLGSIVYPSSPPAAGSGLLPADGAEYTQVDYPALFAKLSRKYTPSSVAAGRFCVPNIIDTPSFVPPVAPPAQIPISGTLPTQVNQGNSSTVRDNNGIFYTFFQGTNHLVKYTATPEGVTVLKVYTKVGAQCESATLIYHPIYNTLYLHGYYVSGNTSITAPVLLTCDNTSNICTASNINVPAAYGSAMAITPVITPLYNNTFIVYGNAEVHVRLLVFTSATAANYVVPAGPQTFVQSINFGALCVAWPDGRVLLAWPTGTMYVGYLLTLSGVDIVNTLTITGLDTVLLSSMQPAYSVLTAMPLGTDGFFIMCNDTVHARKTVIYTGSIADGIVHLQRRADLDPSPSVIPGNPTIAQAAPALLPGTGIISLTQSGGTQCKPQLWATANCADDRLTPYIIAK